MSAMPPGGTPSHEVRQGWPAPGEQPGGQPGEWPPPGPAGGQLGWAGPPGAPPPTSRTSRRLLVIGLVVVLVAVAGAVGVWLASGSGPAPASPPGYLFQDADAVAFVQWNPIGSFLTGTMDLSYVDAFNHAKVDTKTASLNAVRSGDTITVSLTPALTGVSYLSGTYDGHTLTLELPQAGGTMSEARFTPASLASYTAAVTALENQVEGPGSSGPSSP
jgi:hypothetical protein